MFKLCLIQLISIVLLISLSIISSESIDENIVSVRIRNGIINGKIETSVVGKPLNVFRGIPYAEPPVGELRFKKPLPVKQWSEPINAFDWPVSCHQNTAIFAAMNLTFNNNYSEDCLYLNIWSTDIGDNVEKLKPVMFFIHGGALTMGTSGWKMQDGQVLAAKEDVVIVSINYRLNTFGFLYTGTDDAPGNVGLWDQALALEWVNDNIRYFGGDSNRITIFGVSAGSWSVGMHVLSPVSRNLYSNAIMNSGAILDNLVETREESLKKWLKGAELIGCTDSEVENKFTQKIINCLKNIEAEKLWQMADNPVLKKHSLSFIYLVVVDGVFLPQKPSKMLKSGDYKQNINLMVSVCEDEGSFMLSMIRDPIKYHPISPQNLTLSEAKEELRQISAEYGVENNGKDVPKLYFSGLSDSNDFDLFRRTIGIAVGDYFLLCPTIEFGKQVFGNSRQKINVFQYLFNSRSDNNIMSSKWYGVSHGSDMIPMFGNPFLINDIFSDSDRRVSEKLMQILSTFAKTGTPPPQEGVEWPEYYRINDNIISPYYEITSEPKAITNFNTGLRINECDYLWKKYFTR